MPTATPRRYYVTTAIPYANAEPHIGHAFELIGTDVVARAKRLLGYDVFFQTGTDEHGQKMLESAEKHGVTAHQYADQVSPRHRDLWDLLDVSYDRFIRTTSSDHYLAVTEFWRRVRDKGDIYKGAYEGWYSVTDEAFVLESATEVLLGNRRVSKETGAEVTWRSEESYFFRWSKYQKPLEAWLEQHPEFIQPTFRANEMVGSFLKPGLQDISISRKSINWGIPVPDDPEHVVYVWFDALINYITGAGFATDATRFQHWWPADLHVVGKDILKFHTLLWPAMCMAAGIDPPRRVFGHGFVSPKPAPAPDGAAPAGAHDRVELRDGIRTEVIGARTTGPDGGGPVAVTVAVYDETGKQLGEVYCGGASPEAIAEAVIARFGDDLRKLQKMSKSLGNVVDPRVVVANYGGNPDPVRYFLLREVDFGGDGIYSDEALQGRYNADLADKLGNLLARTLTMIEKYQEGRVDRPEPTAYEAIDDDARAVVMRLFGKAEATASAPPPDSPTPPPATDPTPEWDPAVPAEPGNSLDGVASHGISLDDLADMHSPLTKKAAEAYGIDTADVRAIVGHDSSVAAIPGITEYERLIDECRFSLLLDRAWAGVSRLNEYINETRPFSLAKDPAQKQRLGAVLYVLAEGLRVIATQVSPVIPRTSKAIWQQLGCPEPIDQVPFERLSHWGYLNGVKCQRGENLFPKAEK